MKSGIWWYLVILILTLSLYQTWKYGCDNNLVHLVRCQTPNEITVVIDYVISIFTAPKDTDDESINSNFRDNPLLSQTISKSLLDMLDKTGKFMLDMESNWINNWKLVFPTTHENDANGNHNNNKNIMISEDLETPPYVMMPLSDLSNIISLFNSSVTSSFNSLFNTHMLLDIIIRAIDGYDSDHTQLSRNINNHHKLSDEEKRLLMYSDQHLIGIRRHIFHNNSPNRKIDCVSIPNTNDKDNEYDQCSPEITKILQMRKETQDSWKISYETISSFIGSETPIPSLQEVFLTIDPSEYMLSDAYLSYAVSSKNGHYKSPIPPLTHNFYLMDYGTSVEHENIGVVLDITLPCVVYISGHEELITQSNDKYDQMKTNTASTQSSSSLQMVTANSENGVGKITSQFYSEMEDNLKRLLDAQDRARRRFSFTPKTAGWSPKSKLCFKSLSSIEDTSSYLNRNHVRVGSVQYSISENIRDQSPKTAQNTVTSSMHGLYSIDNPNPLEKISFTCPFSEINAKEVAVDMWIRLYGETKITHDNDDDNISPSIRLRTGLIENKVIHVNTYAECIKLPQSLEKSSHTTTTLTDGGWKISEGKKMFRSAGRQSVNADKDNEEAKENDLSLSYFVCWKQSNLNLNDLSNQILFFEMFPQINYSEDVNKYKLYFESFAKRCEMATIDDDDKIIYHNFDVKFIIMQQTVQLQCGHVNYKQCSIFPDITFDWNQVFNYWQMIIMSGG